MDYAVDPCEDFYQFVCNNYIKNAPSGSRNMKFDELFYKLQMQEQLMLKSSDFEDSRSAKAVQNFYARCLSSESEWSSSDGSIAFVLRKIRQYGGFPIIGDKLRHEDWYELTDLLAYFNRDTVTTMSMVPTVAAAPHIGSQSFLTFYPMVNIIISKLNDKSIYYSRKRMESTPEFQFFENIAKRICHYTKSCDGETMKKDLLELTKFTLVVNSLVMEYNHPKLCDKQATLEEINTMTALINWTNYLNKIRPENAEPFTSDMRVKICEKKYFTRLDTLLRMAPKRVTTNYVMMMYTIAWTEYLGDDFREILKNYANQAGAGLSSREEFCARQTWRVYGFSIMLAMYARQNRGREIEEHATQITTDIIAEFDKVLRMNTWMNTDSKQALLLKLRNMEQFVAYEDQHFNLKAFDSLLKDYIQEEDFKQNRFLELKDKYDRLKMEETIHCLSQCKVGFYDMKSLADLQDCSALIPQNAIEVRPAMFQYPLFDAMLPMSFNYGAVGAAISHEIMHHFHIFGRPFDANAELNFDWLTIEWDKEFERRLFCFLEYYNNSEVLFYEDGKALKTNLTNRANLTLEEDLVDNEGLKISFKAHRTYLRKHGPEDRFADKEDFTSDQIFFIGYSLSHCTRYTWEGMEYHLNSDEHSLAQLRVNKVVANRPEFAEAFHCAPGKRLNPEKRCNTY